MFLTAAEYVYILMIQQCLRLWPKHLHSTQAGDGIYFSHLSVPFEREYISSARANPQFAYIFDYSE